MKLLTKEIEKKLPKLGSTSWEDDADIDPKIIVKFFHPRSSWTWYVIEGEKQGNDWLFFGFVNGLEGELGYFSLSQLESIGMIERDRYFEGSLKELGE